MRDYFDTVLGREELLNMSSRGLAHIGDGVFELLVRTWLCVHGKATSKSLHKATVSYVSAGAQAQAIERLLPVMTQEETEVYRRGRNSKPHSIPKNASADEYAKATGLEALFGWLWLSGRKQRINELFAVAMGEVL